MLELKATSPVQMDQKVAVGHQALALKKYNSQHLA